MEKLFHLKENNTTVRTEIVAGLTTFMTMAYIIALNPNLLTNFAVGTPLWNGVFLATCIASAIGTICMAFFANKPFVMAPGMGLNSFFAVVVANIAVINECEYESAFQAALSSADFGDAAGTGLVAMRGLSVRLGDLARIIHFRWALMREKRLHP